MTSWLLCSKTNESETMTREVCISFKAMIRGMLDYILKIGPRSVFGYS